MQLRGAYGVVGSVVEVIRRSKPAFFGYLVNLNGKPVELAGTDVVEPPRPLLEESRRWQEDLLGWEHVALLDDARLAQLRMEWTEVYKALAKLRPDMIPHRGDGVQPVHRVSIRKTTERYEAWSSNGAHLRVRERHSWWLRCPCGHVEVTESSQRPFTNTKGQEPQPAPALICWVWLTVGQGLIACF
ncbi:hypothetical protein [Nonomuraea dietziae]|uniref:Uncharacterized protein n=1 Tax=Nonomuraea dietziae TaxID=65515 RepID=A0A7W5V6R8_9ACTN|nr:hypothetical protein [Nonomuraea dietziae]MBB3726070.1 hypothetical protein [Nonomuraea dietziae]